MVRRTKRGWLVHALVLLLAPAIAAAGTAERFVEAINTANGTELNELIDVGALGGRVIRNLDLNAVDRARYLASLRAQYSLLGTSLAAQMGQQNAKAALLRSDSDSFMVRLTTTDARGNHAHGYLEVQLGEDGRIVDWYDHSMALSMSGQLAFSAVGMLTTGEVAQLLFGDAGDAVEIASLMQGLSRALVLGDMARAHSILMQMPESVQEKREFATLRIALARSVGMDAYREALAELARRHGTAGELQLILIDHYLLAGQNELALKAVEHVAKTIGNDEVMEANRCHALLEMGRIADALAACDRAIALDPKFHTPRWTRVRLALKTKDAPLAIESLNGAEAAEDRRFDAADLAENELYAWLVEQPEWAPWATARGWTAP